MARRAAAGLLLLVAMAHGAEDATTPLMLETFSGGLAGWVSSSVDKYTGTYAPGVSPNIHAIPHTACASTASARVLSLGRDRATAPFAIAWSAGKKHRRRRDWHTWEHHDRVES
jgi:hypothetical protein